MMRWGTGRERASEEYRGLLEQAGRQYIQTRYPRARTMGMVEGANT